MSTRDPVGGDDPTLSAPVQHPSSPPEEGQFLPGTVLAQRYRIVNLLGRGGMGEVYRATDLLLGQTVALKFLPPATARDEAALTRFRDEVRIARQVSHPNVCRVYDIGEAAGLVFLSMEYVDGEDLAALLRRIGHLPPDKAAEIARELCAGLHAAHEKGVIHRDLKPANIMLDGQGRVRVMDFGLASFAAQDRGARGGTPAYMAPEQSAGLPLSTRTDIYALGIVLHEIYTGKRPADTPTSPGLLDPRVDFIIRRCLSADPQRRPATALAVSAALPGGDPLAAALAAGETPSPEMVANAGPIEGMPVRAAVLCLGILAAALAGLFVLSPWQPRTAILPSEAPEVLASRAREYVRALGYDYAGVDAVTGFEDNYPLLRKLAREKSGPDRAASLKSLEPPALTFWYRQHPAALFWHEGRITRFNPWFSPESIEVVLDPKGRLVEFHAAPPRRKPLQPGPGPDWNRLFALAGLDPARFRPVPPEFTPRTYADLRNAWSGSYVSAPDMEIRVEAAAFEGRVSMFRVIVPSLAVERPGGELPFSPRFLLFFNVTLPVAALILAWRNIARGRADWSGAIRLAVVAGLLHAAGRLLTSHHVASMEGAVLFWALVWGASNLVALTCFYLAFEPYVRRREPRMLVSLSRLLEGRWRDARIGSDILIGLSAAAAAGTAGALATRLLDLVPFLTSRGLSVSLAEWLGWVIALGSTGMLWTGLTLLFLFAFARFLFRRAWLAAAVAVLILALAGWPPGRSMVALPYWIAMTFVLGRFGLVAVMAATFTSGLLAFSPLTLDLSKWHAWQGFGAVLILLALALFAFWTNLGGRPLWRDEEAPLETAAPPSPGSARSSARTSPRA